MSTIGDLQISFNSNDTFQRYLAVATWIRNGELKEVKVEATYESGSTLSIINNLLEEVDKVNGAIEEGWGLGAYEGDGIGIEVDGYA